MASESESSLGLAAFAIVIIIAGLYFTSGDKPSDTAATSPVPVAETSKRLAACNALVDAGRSDGIIRGVAGHRIEVEEVGWAGLPYHTKQSVLEAMICVQTGGRPASSSDTAAAYGYRSGKRLLMMTGDGLPID